MVYSKIYRHFQSLCSHRFLLLVALLPALAILSSCGGGGGSTTATPTISVSCFPSSLTVTQQAQCTASIANLSSTLATFSVTGTGNGTIDPNSGVYTAPTTFSSTNNVITITASAQAQPSLTATTTITITQPTAITAVSCVDSNRNVATTAASGQTLTCTATTTGGVTVPSNWAVSGPVGFDLGTITNQGIYTAPLIPPPGQTVTLTATSQAVSTQTMSTAITATFGNLALSGTFVFSTSGRVISNNGFLGRAGIFTAGQGTLSGGTEDTNQSGNVQMTRPFTGTYSIGPDGRGTMQFCEDTSIPCTGTPTSSFRISVASAAKAELIEFSSLITGAGEIVKLDPSILGQRLKTLSGTYSFDFAGVSSASSFESAIGQFNSNGNGNILAGASGANQFPGSIDINIAGGSPSGVQLLPGTSYTVSTNGRGTAQIGSMNFAFYPVSATQAKFIEIDSAPSSILVGDAFNQQTPLLCGWGKSSFSGATVFETSGMSGASGIGDVGIFTLDGNNGVTAGSVDQNDSVAVTPNSGLTGAYAVDPCGRSTLTLGTHSYVFYPVSTSSSILQEITSGVSAHGIMVSSTGGPFSNASFSGSYALNLSGVNASALRVEAIGQLTANGTGNVSSASIDTNNFGVTQSATSQMGTYTTVAANGRTTVLLGPVTRGLVLYFLSPAKAFALDTAVPGVSVGALNKQF